ncbi:sulfite oxidase heme-binding subunit YedZ [uncultured Litoreibacter sp.]|uniref:sulfite oxidase heme-binding subunit YedZ n=1 Tax=uncultured Litoreibacter sp. TaxID=1392394 RepID=UPI00260BC1F3|nr:protein-methionine-sulfoxide reductase heme-binding subunit MsrQ [uncultured Litoreibacter sp.]
MSHALTVSERINTVLRPVPKWLVYVVGALPGIYIVVGVALALSGTYDLFGNSLGVDPAKTIEHWLGELALQFFIATMSIRVLRDFFKLKLIKFRRALGHLTFFYIVLHLSVWLWLDLQWNWALMWSDIVKRPYITIGMAAFLILIPVMATSNNAAIKRYGPRVWQNIHKLAYPAILLGGIHFVMVKRVWLVEPMIYLGVIVVLLALRGRALLPVRA